MIRMQYILKKSVLNSRRGKYQVATLEHNPMIWTPLPLDTISSSRHQDVIAEIDYAIHGELREHKYWKNEPEWWIEQYENFYHQLFSLKWIHNNEDRHSIVANQDCCLTLVQYHNHTLIAYSRSTDMRNGYYSDKLVLEYLAECITNNRPDCKVDKIIWYMAIPHVYKERGIARLTEDEETT